MKLYKIIQEQEEEETTKEVRKITPVHKRMLNALSRMEIDSTSYTAIWEEVRDVFKINDDKLAEEITYLYYEYEYLFDEDEKVNSYHELPDDALEGLEGEDYYEDKHIALARHLDIPPFLIKEGSWDHYELQQYDDLYNNRTYAVGDEDEVQDAMKEWAQEYYDSEGIEYMDRYHVDDYIDLNDMSDFAEEEVDVRIDDMDDDDIIEEAGYDKDQMVDNRESMMSNVVELKEEMESIQTEREGLQEVLDEMEEENEGAYETEEYQEIEEQQNDLEYQYDEKDSEVDDLEDEISDLEHEIDNLLDTAKEELKESKVDDLVREIEDEGIDYFIDNLGYSLSEAVENFAWFDESGFVDNLADSEDRERLAYYDNTEEWEEVDGIPYYIYRTE
jgi:hypothetical protein